jgi:hypothetical protein
MNSAAQRYLLNMRANGSYVIPDRDAERYLTGNGFCEYQKPGLRFILLTPKGAAYAEREKRWLKTGRTG